MPAAIMARMVRTLSRQLAAVSSEMRYCSSSISKEDLDKIAQGRVWTGSKAKEIGLVDELGGLDKALDIAIAKAGVDAYTVMSYPKKERCV